LNLQNYSIRTATSEHDITRLKNLFDLVFLPEPVGELAETLVRHHPNSELSRWFMVEHTSGELVAACTLIPWQWS